jgi:photosystem II stability/assembly factor-like uncharacterized protein
MKTRITLVALTLIFFIQQGKVFSQVDPSYNYDINKPQGEAVKEAIEYLDNYYEENYFSLGFEKTEMSGTGYYPYQRMKWFYEMRADENGEVPFLKRWNAYMESKNNLFNDNQVTVTANWINLGPTNNGGRMISHAFDPTNTEILWVGSAAGGLWRTPDGGDSWEPMTDYLPSLGVGAVAINPNNRNIMLIGTGEAYGWRFMVNGVGILKSTDRGLTWNQTSFTYLQAQGVTCYTIVWDPVNTNNVYAGCNNGLWRSTDMGESWTQALSGRATAILINKHEPSILYTSIQASGIYKSTNTGESWNILGNGIPQGSSIGFTSMAICDAFPNVLYAGLARNDGSGKLLGFYRSNDSGGHWALLSTPDFYCYIPPYENICQGWYDNVTSVSPVDSNLVYANGINLYRSTDGGNTWTTPAGPLFNPSVHVDHHSFGFDPSNPAIVYAFNDGGVYKSTDNGDSWVEKNDGLITFQFYSIASAMTDTKIVSGGSQDNSTQVVDNSNGNTNWSVWWGGDGMITNIDYTNSQIMYGEQQFGLQGKTINGGLSSFPINNGITESGPWITPVVMDPVDPTILYTASNAKIYKTTNSGQNWTSAVNISNCKILAIDRINHDYIYASVWNYGSGTNVFWRSTDGGINWEQGTSPGWRVTDIEASPTKEGVLYATQNAFDGNPRVYKSLDYGDSWTNITNNLPPVGTNAITINPYNTEHLYLATDLGVYVSINDGGEWIEYNNNLPNVFTFDIHFHPADTTVRAGTFGRGCWKAKAVDASITSVTDEKIISIPADFVLYQNYPNPFNPRTSIRFELKYAGNVTGKIFNQSGQEIIELFSEYREAGTNIAHWDGDNANGLKVSSGIYYYRLTVDGISRTMKMLLIK